VVKFAVLGVSKKEGNFYHEGHEEKNFVIFIPFMVNSLF